MLFTPEQVSLILEDIDFQGCVLVASILGKEMLTDADKELLKKYKVNLDSLVINFPPAQQAYLFGRLVPILTPNQIGTISYKDFVSYLERNQYRTPTQREIEEYKIVANRSYSYIKGLGTRMKEMTTNFISEAELELATKRREAESLKVIKEELTTAVLERKAVQKITSDIAGRLNDWQRDWGRIVETELQNIYNLGNAQTIEEEHGVDALVYKEVYPGACRHCIRLYLTGGIGSRPKVFKLSELRANGTNIGKKVADWKPVEGTTHPWCFNSGTTKIFTANGWKNIKDIEVGDLVLTHLNRFRPVTETYKRVFDREEVEIFNIHFETVTKYGRPKRGILRRITGNHPVLVNGEWVSASKIKEGDFLERKELKCDRCDKYIPLNGVVGWSLDLCGNCSNRISAIEQWKDEDIRKIIAEKARIQMNKRYEKMTVEEKRELTKEARKVFNRKYPDGRPWQKEVLKKVNVTNGRRKTFIERKLIHFLEYLGIEYEVGKFLENDGTFVNDVKGYFPDVFIPKLGIVFEADGSHWHNPDYDKVRDEDIKRVFGYDTFRFSEEEIRNKGEEVCKKISNICNNHSGLFRGAECKVVKIEKLEFSKKSPKYLYNFAVEEDESYLADGVIVHNCRCELKYLPEGWVWDEQEGRFRAPKVSKEERVQRTSKVKIDVGDRHFEV